MMRGKRYVAIVLCIVFLLTVVGCSAFLATHLNHLHTGCHCATCASISTAGNLLTACKQVLLFTTIVAAVLLGCVCMRARPYCVQKREDTLSSLNVMLTE